MPMCKYCGQAFQWGSQPDGKWALLIPFGEEDGHPLKFQDEQGRLRADHRDVCTNRGGAAIRVVRLAKDVPAGHVIGTARPEPEPPRGRRRRRKSAAQVADPDTGEIPDEDVPGLDIPFSP